MATLQIWRPDTCKCIVEEKVENGEKTLSQIIKKCEAHASVPDAELYDVIYAGPNGENRRKNLVHGFMRAEVGDNLDYKWAGSGKERVLQIRTPRRMAASRKQSLQDFLAEKSLSKVELI